VKVIENVLEIKKINFYSISSFRENLYSLVKINCFFSLFFQTVNNKSLKIFTYVFSCYSKYIFKNLFRIEILISNINIKL